MVSAITREMVSMDPPSKKDLSPSCRKPLGPRSHLAQVAHIQLLVHFGPMPGTSEGRFQLWISLQGHLRPTWKFSLCPILFPLPTFHRYYQGTLIINILHVKLHVDLLSGELGMAQRKRGQCQKEQTQQDQSLDVNQGAGRLGWPQLVLYSC